MTRFDRKGWALCALVACGIANALGCQAGDQEPAPGEPSVVAAAGARAPLAAACDEADALRGELSARIASSRCSEASCELVEFEAQPAAPASASLGKRVLLIDDGIVVPAATRYARRTLAFLARGEDGRYRETRPRFSIAPGALEVLQTLDERAPRLPAEQLSLTDAFFGKFSGDALPETSFGHGMDMLPFLAEMVPDAQFVVSDDQLDPPADCDFLGDADARAAAFARLGVYIEAMRSSLSAVIEAHAVHAIHLSWGLAYGSLDRVFEAHCDAQPKHSVSRRIMQWYAKLFADLTRLETLGADGRRRRVVLFQAGAPSAEGASSEDNLDCADVERRVRVFDVAYDGTAVPAEGTHDPSLLPSAPDGSNLACNDLFLVMGYRDIFSPARSAGYFGSRPFGLGLGPPGWPAASSFATPIALAHYFEVQRTAPDESSDDWLERLTQHWSAPILDPLLYDAFPRGPVEACND